jgi:hypothetical protein
MLNDVVIDYWADIYRACGLQAEISFELFLSDPWRHLREFGQETAPALIEQGWRPLLPAQARVARELAIAERRVECVSAAPALARFIPSKRKVAPYSPAPRVCAPERIRGHADPADRTAR